MGGTGLSALIHLAAALEIDHGMETLALGRAAVDDADCVLETGGRHLAYRVALHGAAGEVRTAATVMDGDGTYQTLLRSRDDAGGWNTTQRLVGSLERHAVRSLERPIKSGEAGGPDAWIIA